MNSQDAAAPEKFCTKEDLEAMLSELEESRRELLINPNLPQAIKRALAGGDIASSNVPNQGSTNKSSFQS